MGGKKCPVVPLNFRNGQLMEMEHVFRKHVKPKKQHEIRQLGKVAGSGGGGRLCVCVCVCVCECV